MLFCEVKNWQGAKLYLDSNQLMMGTLASELQSVVSNKLVFL